MSHRNSSARLATVSATLFVAGLIGSRAARVETSMAQGVLSATKETSTTAQADEQVSRCCCRGPDPRYCLLLNEDDGVEDGIFYDHCPHKNGYRFYQDESVKFETTTGSKNPMPDQCLNVAPRPTPKPVTVTIYWMRHGFSCANVFSVLSKNKTRNWFDRKGSGLDQIMYSDPPLTDYAIEQAKAIREQVQAAILADRAKTGDKTEKVFDRVFSSVMIRAMETALWNFENKGTENKEKTGSFVRPLPYCAEKGGTADNVPKIWDAQQAILLAKDGEAFLERVKFDVSPKNHPLRAKKGYKDSYKTFLKYFASVLNQRLKDEGTEVEAGEDIPVIVVSHSHFMQKSLTCGGPDTKPYNNEVWVEKYDLILGAWDAELVPKKDCKALIAEEPEENRNSFRWPRPPSPICPRHVDRCGTKPEAWIKATRAQCGEDAETR